MKTRNKFLLAIFIIIVLLIAIFIYTQTNKNKVCFDKNCFNVKIASSQEELSNGLMFRQSLNRNSGMLFIFPEENFYNFWMKNTLISLDIIWINSNKEIVFIQHNAQPCQEENCEIFISDKRALYVLEINSGIAEEIGLEVGNAGTFKLE